MLNIIALLLIWTKLLQSNNSSQYQHLLNIISAGFHERKSFKHFIFISNMRSPINNRYAKLTGNADLNYYSGPNNYVTGFTKTHQIVTRIEIQIEA